MIPHLTFLKKIGDYLHDENFMGEIKNISDVGGDYLADFLWDFFNKLIDRGFSKDESISLLIGIFGKK